MLTTNEKIANTLKTLEWQIEDAKRDLAKAADALARRTQEGQEACRAMLANEPTSTMWLAFLGGDVQRATETKARLDALIEQQKLVQYLDRQDNT